jgi:propionate CoA-transferase
VRQAGGRVYAQALQFSDSPLPPHQVAVPAGLIDGVVMASSRIMHPHTGRSVYDGRFLLPFPGAGTALPDPMPVVSPGMAVARRTLRELRGCSRWMTAPGLPEEFPLALMAEPEGMQPPVSSFGVVGGYPLQGDDMGASLFACAFMSLADTAAHCAGGLDAAVLPLGYVSAGGDVNTGYPGNRPAGCGAVVELAHAARKVVFCGSFMADDVEMTVGQGALTIVSDGHAPRFANSVTHRTLAADEALRNGRTILLVTERCVIRVTPDGLTLDEVAPGINTRKDILDRVPVPLRGADTARTMDPACFT